MVDMMIIHYIIFSSSSTDMFHETKDKRNYTWINHDKFREDLPFLELTEPTLRRRLVKLKESGMIDSIVISNEMKGKRTYYGITPYCDSLRKSRVEEGYKLSDDHVSKMIHGENQVSKMIPDTSSPSIKNDTSDNQTNLYNQTNSRKENPKEKKSLLEETMDEYPIFVSQELREAYRDFAEMRAKKKKPLNTKRALRISLNRLVEIGNNNVPYMIRIIEASIEGSWDKFYPPKDSNDYFGDELKRINSEKSLRNIDGQLKLSFTTPLSLPTNNRSGGMTEEEQKAFLKECGL